ncbi:MAG TPA: amidase, partial [Anaerolineales bacterium]|nr:amidase [Anaerolineales bacterium]
MDDPQTLTIHAALEKLRGGQISPHDLVEACSRRIEQLNSKLNAFITVIDHDEVLTAQLPEDHFPASKALRGIPLALKDLFETAGVRTTAGSKFFAEYIPEQDAFVVEKLKRAGALLMGKTNTHEIALGVTGNNPHYGTARNPWDPRRIPGGSSAGSAIAVATGMALG